VHTLSGSRIYLSIHATEPDTNNPEHSRFSATPLFQVPDTIETPEQFYDWILDVCIPGVDTHERWEWFRVGGKPWRDVHAPGMPAFSVDPNAHWDLFATVQHVDDACGRR
jgi:hypothetical protein